MSAEHDAMDRCIHQLFIDQAARTPDAEAVAFGGESLSYRELARRADLLARHLRRRGAGPDSLVGLAVERSLDMIVGLLGVLQAGGAYVPLDPGYPRERLDFLWEDTRAGNRGCPSVLLTWRSLAGLLPRTSDSAVYLDEPLGEPEPGVDGTSAVTPDNVAYVIYTSGSTGRPKGVVVPHRGVVHVAREGARLLEVGPGSRFLQISSLGFDASILEIFTSLTTGGCVVLTPRETLLSGEALGRVLREERISNLVLPPSLLDTIEAGAERELPHLRSILVGGEACSAVTAARWSAGRRMVNAYAPTEATVFATANFCDGQGVPTLGGPIARMSVHLMDQDGVSVEGTGDGEIHLGGVGVVRGYLNRPELTAERFVPDPFSTVPGARLYRSGDLARRLPDGDLLFLGRVDFQVKIRGNRVELGEIEAVLGEHAGVQTAVAVARSEGSGKRLVAYVVRRDPALTVSALRAFLTERLPDYMVPEAFVFLAAMPMTPTGKVDRRALPAPGRSRPEMDAVYAPPRDEREATLARIWEELLRIEGVGVNDDLFELGGHSLLASQIVTRVRQELGVDLALPEVFERPTVALLAERLRAPATAPAEETLPPIGRAPRDRPIPLSYAQERVWFLNQLAPGNCAYNFQVTVRFRGLLRPAVLRQVLAEIVRRHEVLRTTFPAADGRPVQVIHPDWPEGTLEVPEVDLRGLPKGEREAAAERLVHAEIRRPFDVERLPLMRWRLMKLDDEDHLFLHVEHHFVHDGWSLAVFLRELVELYTAFVDRLPSPLPELSVQYADFTVWQRGWLEGGALAGQLAWWKERLAGSPPVLEMPTDRPRPRVHGFRGGALRADLPAPLYERTRAFGRREAGTLFMTALAAFYALLHRYTGQTDMLLGSGIANRRLREIEGLIGMVVNTIVLRAAADGGLTFRELLARVRRATLEAHAHQDMPFEKLVEELRPDRELSRNPLFQVLFSFHDAPVPDLELAGLSGDLLERHNGSAKSDLNVVAKPRAEQRVGLAGDAADAMTFIWEYSGDLFDAATIDRMWAHYQTLLAGVVADPGLRLSEAPLLTEGERVQLAAWSTPALSSEERRPAHHLIAGQASRRPDALAVAGGGVRWTYRELVRGARSLAARLRALGVGPETVVAVCAERSPETVLAALAVLEAGGAYLPLDPAYPAERLRFLLEDPGAAAVLVRPDLRAALPGLDAAVPVLEIGPLAGEKGATDESEDPDRLAYVIYTSGSTGRPKGVEIPHRGLSNLIAWHCRTYEVTPDDRATLLAGPAFDASVWEIWPALAAGASLHIPDAATRSDPARLLSWLAAEEITLAFLPTPLAEALLEIAERGLPAGLKLRALLTGGDRLRRAPAPGLPFLLVNHYGPTESSVVATAAPVFANRGRTLSGAPPIGRPIDGISVHLLDPAWRRVPQGVPGELCIGGAGLARGYRGQPALTAEKLLPDPWGETPGDRLYRTGDLARWLPDGQLEFLGRLDHQVKIRGFRIELGEIETVLGGHPGVREAVVVAHGDGEERRLVAYAVPEPGSAPAAEELHAWLGERLPAYMAPAAFVPLATLPLTPNGKVDLRALPEPDWGRGAGERGSAAPRTPLEELLAGIWSAVLGIPEVGLHDNFFKLGGHSLIATRVLSRVRDAVGAEVPLATLFEAPTVASLARAVEEVLRGPAGAEAGGPIPRRPEGEPAPLSFAQERLWFLDQLTPGVSAYNIARAFALRGRLDPAALARAAGGILGRHEALRTTFGVQGDRPVQVVSQGSEIRLPLVDLSGCTGPLRASEADRLLRAEARRPFDLERGPLLRMTLLRLGPEEHRLALTLHHIVADGWSMGLFFRELAALYGETAAGVPAVLAALPGLPVQYPDFALWQRGRLQGERLDALIAHWKRELAGAPALLELPTDRPRPVVQSYRGAQVELELPPELAGRLRDLARLSGSTLFMALLAAFGALFARITGRRDILLGSPVAGRNRSETEDLIGFFVNNLVLRLRWEGDPHFGGLLEQARRVTLTAHAHQELPFEKLVAELAPTRNLGHTPLFQVVLALQSEAEALDMPGLGLTPLPVSRGESRFDLELGVVERGAGQGLRVLWRYDRDLFDGATVERLAGHFRELLGGVVADSGQALSELPLLTCAEREELLTWGAPGAAFPQDRCLHELFAAQAVRTPGAVAVVCEGAGLTYGELVEGAHRLARFLRGLGVRPGDLVGLCLERSLDLVVAVLGVLEAGAAYLPLDPTYPPERLAFALDDSRAGVLLTREETAAALPAGIAGMARVVRLDADREAIGRESAEPLPVLVTPDFPAYVIYTSGSTGRPKGVVVTHANVTRLFAATDAWYGFRPEDVWTLFHSYAFDFSVWELWGALLHGGRLVVVPYWVSRSPEAFCELLRSERVTVLNQTPSAFRQLLWAEEGSHDLALRLVLFGGEALELASLAPWFDRHGDERPRLVNMYGITETTVHVTYRPISRRDLIAPRGSVIGAPLPDLSLRVLDPRLAPQPIGVPGEICVGGAGLAHGYLGRPELTAERFVPDPFGPPGARLYRSGDLARYRPQGDLEYLGRIDHQVKIRGFRIEPGEIEAALAAQPEIRAAVVLAREDVPGDRRLVAYLIAERDREIPAGELRERLQVILPEPMIPAAFVVLAAFPLTASGKVDRGALPAPETSRPDLESAYTAPETADERWLAEVWAEVLGIERVGVHDDFFHLGGHSLLAARVIARMRRHLQVDLPLRSLFQGPTIAGLLRAVQQARVDGGGAAAPRIAPVSRAAHRRVRPAERSTP